MTNGFFEFPHDLKADELREERRFDAAAPNLGLHIVKAAQRFDSVNPDHALPNILVIANHAPLRGPLDLRHALEGLEAPDGHHEFLIFDENEKEVPGERQKEVWRAARSIDLYLWIDAQNALANIAYQLVQSDWLRPVTSLASLCLRPPDSQIWFWG